MPGGKLVGAQQTLRRRAPARVQLAEESRQLLRVEGIFEGPIGFQGLGL